MSWDAAFAAEREAAARGPLAANPATFGEIWDASWNAAGLDTAFGVGATWGQAHDELRSQIETVSGQSLSGLAEAQGKRLRAEGYAGATLQEQARELADLASGLTPEQQDKIKPYLDIPARARTLAAERDRQAADVAERTYGLSGHAVGFIAGAARQAVDPVNLATMFVGGPARSALLPMLAREFGLGASIQAIQEPAIEAGRADLGLEAGFGRAVTNTIEAGIGNAGLAGLFRGAGWLMRRAVEVRDGAAARPAVESVGASERARLDAPSTAALPAALRDLSAEDVEAAGRLLERDHLMDQQSPDPSSAGKAAHAEAVDAMATRLETSAGEILANFEKRLAQLEADAEPVDFAPKIRAKLAANPPSYVGFAGIDDVPTLVGEISQRLGSLEQLARQPVRGLDEARYENGLSSLYSSLNRLEQLSGSRTHPDIDTRLRAVLGDAQGETVGGPEVSPPASAPARRRPDRPRKPVSLARFIAMQGGIRLDADASAAGFDRAFIPGWGPLARRTGRAIDQLEPLLIEEGYLPRQPADAPSRDITAELYQALDDEIRHRQPRYAERDQAAVVDRQAEAEFAQDQRWRDEIAAEAENIRARMAEVGHDATIHAGDIEAAAELIVRGVETDWGDALERVAIMAELGDDASIPAAREILDDIPGWELDDAVSAREASPDREAAGRRGEDAARPADRRGPAPEGGEVPQPGQDGAAAGGRQGDTPLATLGRLAAATDDPAAFKARLADLDRAMAAAGGDLTVHLDGGDVSLRARLDEIRADADAADALKACLGQGSGGAGGAP